MENTGNLLATFVKEKKAEELSRLDGIKLVDSLFTELLDRERDVLSRRFGLKGEKGETLEQIGQLHKLTRERVRQIEAASLKKIKKLENLLEIVSSLKDVVKELILEHGGLVRRDYLLDILTVVALEVGNGLSTDHSDYEAQRSKYRNHFNLIISKILSDDLELVDESDSFNTSVKLKEANIDHLSELAIDLLAKVSGLNKTMTTEDLLQLIKQSEVYIKNESKFGASQSDISPIFKSQLFNDQAATINDNKILYSLMQAVKDLEQNKYGAWGMSDWGEIRPKTVNDKIYLVLKNNGQPLHFTEIANKINEMKFDKKVANSATVHNELILDDRYVLMNRGTYGLKEWQK